MRSADSHTGTEATRDVGTASARILLVEDEPAIRDVLAYHLERAGHTVLVAGDGVTGLACAREQSPELLIVDLMLPRMSGTDLIRQLRRESDAAVLLMEATTGLPACFSAAISRRITSDAMTLPPGLSSIIPIARP